MASGAKVCLELFGQPVPRLQTIIAMQDQLGSSDVRFTERFLIPAGARGHFAGSGTGDNGDAAMAELQQVANAFARPAHVVEQDRIRVDFGHGPVEKDD